MSDEEITLDGEVFYKDRYWMTHSCIVCKHFNPFFEADSCKAFPHGIPKKILEGKVIHDKPYEGDGGIQFELMGED